MNDIIRQLGERMAMRGYTTQPIAAEEKEAILRAAVMAPTVGCQQLYTILDITDAALKARLADLCDGQSFINKGQLVLIFCADMQKMYDVYASGGCDPRKPGCGDLMLAITDALCAAQNATVAADSLGIASSYVGEIAGNCESIRELLHLPEYVLPVTMLVFGYPAAMQFPQPREDRVEMQYVIHENGYQAMDTTAVRTMLHERAGAHGFDTWARNFCKRRYHTDFAAEMNRSVAEYLKSFE